MARVSSTAPGAVAIVGFARDNCRRKSLKDRSATLKWLLVVCFGYLGYKRARFGKLESHEAVTADSRKLLLLAKDVTEEMGFEILHMYIDSLFIKKKGLQMPRDFDPLLEAIAQRTGYTSPSMESING